MLGVYSFFILITKVASYLLLFFFYARDLRYIAKFTHLVAKVKFKIAKVRVYDEFPNLI